MLGLLRFQLHLALAPTPFYFVLDAQLLEFFLRRVLLFHPHSPWLQRPGTPCKRCLLLDLASYKRSGRRSGFPNAEVAIRGGVPLLGEHNGRVLGHLLGYSSDQVAALTTSVVLVQDAQLQRIPGPRGIR